MATKVKIENIDGPNTIKIFQISVKDGSRGAETIELAPGESAVEESKESHYIRIVELQP